MIAMVLEYVPVAVWLTVVGVAWRGQRRLTTIEVHGQQALENTVKCETQLVAHGERLGNIEGQLKRMNGG